MNSERPESIKVARRLLWGLLAAGAALVVASLAELDFLNGNLPVIAERSTFLAEAEKSAGRVHDSASLALGLGIVDMVGALVLWPVLTWGVRFGRLLIIAFAAFAAATHVLLILQDGTIGVQPYTDMSHDLAQQELINSLLVWPGYFMMLYPAESAGLILAIMIGWKMFQEPTIEHFQQRRRVTREGIWDVGEILARRQD